MRQSPLRVAVLGAGYFSQFHYRAWQRMSDVELVAVCDLDPERAQNVALQYGAAQSFTDLVTMLDNVKPDVLDVAAPPPTHYWAIDAAAKRGIDVVCQKPFCGDLATAEQAVAVAQAAGISLIVHENFRFQPWYGVLRRLVESGDLGKVYQATFWVRPGDGQGADAYLARQPYFQQMPRFAIHETGIHHVDVLRYLFGEVRSVQAWLRQINPVIAGEDAGVVVMELTDGIIAVLDINRNVDHVASNRRRTLGEMRIEGELGTVRLTGDAAILLRRHGENEETTLDYAWQDEDFGGDCVYLTQRAAADALLGRGPIVNAGYEYISNLKIEEAIYASSADGRRVVVD